MVVQKEDMRGVKLPDPPSTEHQDAVRVHNGVQPVGNGESGAVNKLPTDGLLDDGISAGHEGKKRN